MGGYLGLSGETVILVARCKHAEAIQRNGLTMKTAKGVLRPPLEAVSAPAGVKWQRDDVIFLTCKSQHTCDLLKQLSKASSETPIFCFQNGVRNEEWAAKIFKNVYGGLVQFSANFIEPGVVEHTRNDVLALGKYPRGLDEVTERIGAILERTGFNMTYYASVMPHKWGKLLVNLNNGLYALINTWLQRAYTEPDTREFLAETMREGADVLKAAGIEVEMGPGEPPAREFILRMAAGRYAYDNPQDLPPDRRTYPSTWQDVVLRRDTTEIEHLNGEIVELGKKVGISTPQNSVLLELTRELLRSGKMPGVFTLEDIKRKVKAQRAG